MARLTNDLLVIPFGHSICNNMLMQTIELFHLNLFESLPTKYNECPQPNSALVLPLI